jgi:hypothetical protein
VESSGALGDRYAAVPEHVGHRLDVSPGKGNRSQRRGQRQQPKRSTKRQRRKK